MKTMNKHRHRVKTRHDARGFSHCVAPYDCNPSSHGGVCFLEECSCGAYRYINSTGAGREETGPWQEATP